MLRETMPPFTQSENQKKKRKNKRKKIEMNLKDFAEKQT